MKKILTIILAASFVIALGMIFFAIIIDAERQCGMIGGIWATMFFVPVLGLFIGGIVTTIQIQFEN